VLFRSQAAGKHPIGFNVRPGVDYGRLLEQVKRMGGCRAMLFHEYQGALDKLHAFRNWVDTIIWRPAHFESETLYQQTDADTWVTGRRLEMLAAGWDPGDLWLHLHNEAGWHADMLHWEAAATIRAVQTGMRVVVINAAVGNPNEHTVSMADTITKRAAQNP